MPASQVHPAVGEKTLCGHEGLVLDGVGDTLNRIAVLFRHLSTVSRDSVTPSLECDVVSR